MMVSIDGMYEKYDDAHSSCSSSLVLSCVVFR